MVVNLLRFFGFRRRGGVPHFKLCQIRIGQATQVLLAKGNAALILNRIPTYPDPEIDGVHQDVKNNKNCDI